jgi:hypothetical protein
MAFLPSAWLQLIGQRQLERYKVNALGIVGEIYFVDVLAATRARSQVCQLPLAIH